MLLYGLLNELGREPINERELLGKLLGELISLLLYELLGELGCELLNELLGGPCGALPLGRVPRWAPR